MALKVHGAILSDMQRQVSFPFIAGTYSLTGSQMMHREMAVWQRIVHPRILPFYGTCNISANQVALVSPYMDKGNLCAYLEDNADCDRLQPVSAID